MKNTYPKILPWLARQADIPLPRTEILWHAACRHAAAHTGETDTPAYWGAAMDRLHELVAAECQREDAAAFGWRNWSRLHKRICEAPLILLDALNLNSLRGWRTMQTLHAS